MREAISEKRHTPRYPAEFRARGVRLFKENHLNYPTDCAAYTLTVEKLGCSGFTLLE